jgi:hypothetical protein
MPDGERTDSPSWETRAIVGLLTSERLSSYLRASHGDSEQALRLYEWNMAAAAAVLHTTGMIEVVVRSDVRP